jgi:class 3 adenylate cyclase
MLREAIDRGDVFRTADGWDRRALAEVQIPETVRDTILLRFARLDPAEAEVLQAAAVLGRTFDYATLLAVAEAQDATVQSALAIGVAQQMVEEVGNGQATYGWRHALTQEAIADEIVLPRRQEIHSRAAEVLSTAGASALQVARHLLGAARFDEAVPVCLDAAKEAEASFAFAEALEVLERALPHVHDPVERSRVLCLMGRVLWTDGKTAAAEAVLAEGIPGLVATDEVEAAGYRLILARAQWEQSKPAAAREEFEEARRVLEQAGPSPELALAYMRLSGLYKFEFAAAESLETAEKAVEVATAAGADFERIWAQSWMAYSLLDVGRNAEGMELLDESFDEARSRGYSFITHNIAYNDAWTRLHTMSADIDDRLAAIASEPGPEVITNMLEIAMSWGLRARGDLAGALDVIERAELTTPPTSSEKVRWRRRLELAEVLLELGRFDDAAALIPPLSERAELQDIVYDAAAQIRLRLATERVGEAAEIAREIAENAPRFAPYWDAVAVAAEAFVSAGLVDEAHAMVRTARSHQTDVGVAFLNEAEGRVLLAQGEAAEARKLLTAVAEQAAARKFRLVEWRARTLAAEATHSQEEFAAVITEADEANAVLIGDAARNAAKRLGLDVPEPAEPSAAHDVGEPELAQSGERLVTMLFADVRGYTALSATTAPADLAERIGTLHRWAAAEVGRQHGFVDKFAGDAVMATFNATGTRLDHAREALEAALALSGKAALLDLGVGIGIAVGPAVVGRTVAGGNVSVLGPTTNLAARLQTAAEAGEIVLSEEAHRRVAQWLEERGLEAVPQTLELKGFDDPQPAFRLRRD